jgi:predicted nucleic acid-binding protein
MRYIFDSSAVVNLVKKGKLSAFSEGCTLDLALYESLNALWKEHFLLKKLSKDDVQEYIDIIAELFSTIEVKSVMGFENKVLENAVKYEITAYDSSYLTYAIENGLTLVTDDEKLSSKAKAKVNVRSTSEIQ